MFRSAAAGGCLLALVLYWPVFTGRIPFPADVVFAFPPWHGMTPAEPVARHAEMGDLVTQMYPWRKLSGEAVRAGELPLWNPYALMGAPHAANIQSAVWYPPNALFYVLPPPQAWAITFPIRTALAYLFACLLARRLGATARSGAVAGLAFACSGFMVGWQGWSNADSALWIPAALLAIERLMRRGGLGSLSLTAGALTMPLLAGHPHLALHAALAVATFALFWMFRVPPADRRRRLALATGSGVVALGLGAIQLLPSVEWLSSLVRTSPHLLDAPTLDALVALVSRDTLSSPNSAGIDIPLGARYVGMLTVVAAPFAAFSPQRREVFWAVFLAVLSAPLAYGAALGSLALALLAGLGLAALEDGRGYRPRAAAVLAGGAVTLAFAIGLIPDASVRALGWTKGPASSILFAAAAIAATAAIVRRPTQWSVLAAVGLQMFDLAGFAYGHVPFVRPADVFPAAPVFTDLQLRAGTQRVASLDMTSPVNAELVFGLSSPFGYDYILERPSRLLHPLSGSWPDQEVGSSGDSRVIGAANDRRLDLMAVRFLVANTYDESAARLAARPDRFRLIAAHGPLRLYENPRARPRAFLIGAEGIERARDEDALWRRLADPGFDPERRVLLEEEPRWPVVTKATPPGAVPEGTASGVVATVDVRFNSVTATTDVTRASVLVLGDVYYPGWNVSVNGHVRPLLRANGTFRAVALEPGRHTVHFAYEPASFRIGAALSALAVLTCLVLVWPPRRRTAQ